MALSTHYVFGAFVWACLCLSICFIYLLFVISSLIFGILPISQAKITNVAEYMTKIVDAYGFHEEYIDISGVKIHYVITNADSHDDDDDDIVVFIHGTASSSLIFFDVMKELSLRQKCVAIDLPNFGISDNIDTDQYKRNQELCEYYADIIGNTLQALNIVKKTILVGHSLGGFLSIYAADRFPIKKLVLLNPAGILPTLGEWGYYWGLFFKVGMPTTAFHLPLVSRNGLVNMAATIYGGSSDNDIITNFWIYFYSNTRNEGHRILQRMITIRPFYSYWNTPALTTLMDVCKKVQTSICFGEADTIIPAHIGGFIDQLTQGEIMIHIVKNASHNPCVNIECIVDFLSSIINGTWKSNQSVRHNWHKTMPPNNNNNNNNKQPKSASRGFSYHSLAKTNESFQSIYAYLLSSKYYWIERNHAESAFNRDVI
jgi:pimeloyl-ACP methyl ester carboxylesterase